MQHKIAPVRAERRSQERDSGRRGKGTNVKTTKNILDYDRMENRFAFLCKLKERDNDEGEDK